MKPSASDPLLQEFAELMQRVRAGSPEAIRELVERYGKEIQLFIRRRLNPRLRPQFDSLDFTQDAWVSFFHLPPERYTFETPRELYFFLTRLARRKLIDIYRRRYAQKRNRHQTEPLRPQTDDDAGNEPAGRQPTPSQVVVAEEQMDLLARDIPPMYRRALEMLREGHSHVEVARFLNVPASTIKGVLQRLRNKRKTS
jgi:RNA polymerase sigma factor (sigma-70 family)